MSTDDPMRDFLPHAGVSQPLAGVQAYPNHTPGPDGGSRLKSRRHAACLPTALGVDLTQLAATHLHNGQHAPFPNGSRTGDHR